MATCSADHASSTDGYCGLCGASVGTPSSAPRRRDDSESSSRTELVVYSPAGPHRDPCPACATPRTTDDRFCERCGHEFDIASAPAGRWTAEVSADRAYYERIASRRIVPDGGAFPDGRRPSAIALGPGEVTIGRREDAPCTVPDIDLTGPLDDPWVSRRHARLVRREEGGYQVVDTGSKNGTRVNDEMTPLDARIPFVLSDGDRIHIGAWTTITLRCPRP